jgi:hypothetical protein
MSAPTAAPCTFETVRKSVTHLLVHFASVVRPETEDCAHCLYGIASMCETHSVMAAGRERLERAAAMAAKAQTRDDVEAALVYAAGD